MIFNYIFIIFTEKQQNVSDDEDQKNVKTKENVKRNKQQRQRIVTSDGSTNNNDGTIDEIVKSGAGSGSGGRNRQNTINNKRNDKTFNHPWLLTSLKGHTDEVHDAAYSASGKYLVSCSEG